MTKVSVRVKPQVPDSLFESSCLMSKDTKRELLAKFIKEKLQRANLRSHDFAEKVSKRPSEITKWLSGNHNFTIDTLFEIEEKLGVTLINLGEPAKKVQGGEKLIEVILSGVKLNLPKHTCHFNTINNIKPIEKKFSFSEEKSVV